MSLTETIERHYLTQKRVQQIITEFGEDQALKHQKVVESFDEYEQSALWKCLNAKKEKWVQTTVNSVVATRSQLFEGPFYRGITHKEVELIENAIMFGTSFTFDRVTSFSSDETIAKQFSCKSVYGTNILLLCDELYAFKYFEVMESILMVAPSIEFMKGSYAWQKEETYLEAKRSDNIGMILDEQEYMVHSKLEFFVQDYSHDGITKVVKLCLA